MAKCSIKDNSGDKTQLMIKPLVSFTTSRSPIRKRLQYGSERTARKKLSYERLSSAGNEVVYSSHTYRRAADRSASEKDFKSEIEALFQDLGSIINMVSGIDKAAQQDTAQPHSVLSWKGRKSCFSDLFDQLLT